MCTWNKLSEGSGSGSKLTFSQVHGYEGFRGITVKCGQMRFVEVGSKLSKAELGQGAALFANDYMSL